MVHGCRNQRISEANHEMPDAAWVPAATTCYVCDFEHFVLLGSVMVSIACASTVFSALEA